MEMEDEGFIPIGLDTGTDMDMDMDEKDSKFFIRVTFCIKPHKLTNHLTPPFLKLDIQGHSSTYIFYASVINLQFLDITIKDNL